MDKGNWHVSYRYVVEPGRGTETEKTEKTQREIQPTVAGPCANITLNQGLSTPAAPAAVCEDRDARCIVWNPSAAVPPRAEFSGPQALRVAESMAASHPEQTFYVAHLVAASRVPSGRLTSESEHQLRAAWGALARCCAVAGVLATAAGFVLTRPPITP